MTEHVLGYGTESVRFSPRLLAKGRLAAVVAARADAAASGLEVLRARLSRPSGTPPLREIARGKRSAAILIPGKARRAAASEYVPVLLDELNAGGIPDEAIQVFLADGTHEQHLADDMVELLGEAVLRRVACLGHDCRDREDHVELGRTTRGTPVQISRRVLAAGVKILTGRIVPHYFAGFSGGRKALIPGVSGFDTILANHRLTLDSSGDLEPRASLCSLDENPVHLDMMEAARLAQPDFCLNTLLDERHRIADAVAGDWEAAHAEGCRRAAEMLRISVEGPLDAVITCAGGMPYDCNFMQAIKAPFNVLDIVRPGGAVLWIAKCQGGMNPGFLQWAQHETYEGMVRAAQEKYALTAHNSLMLRRLVRKARVALWSDLDPAAVAKIGLHPVAGFDDGLRWLESNFSGPYGYALVPQANVLCASVRRAAK